MAASFMQLGGGSPKAGRQLLSWVLKAGVARDQTTLTYGTWYYNSVDEKRTWAQAMAELVRGGRMRGVALDAKLATEDELEEMAKAWDDWWVKEDASLAMMLSEILIQLFIQL
ncbi:hypothetical protein F4818DRAFT_66300 [Hypoxylon cercidicola]|nr:hypothetical protein F4818DRAFT_66300 [Hypoxylon cercidicola]